MDELAEKYLLNILIDYGDLTHQAEKQIKKAYIDGMKLNKETVLKEIMSIAIESYQQGFQSAVDSLIAANKVVKNKSTYNNNLN